MMLTSALLQFALCRPISTLWLLSFVQGHTALSFYIFSLSLSVYGVKNVDGCAIHMIQLLQMGAMLASASVTTHAVYAIRHPSGILKGICMILNTTKAVNN